ncbi:hypothetical protein DV515_00015412, partial [Chloebia gouldiae]
MLLRKELAGVSHSQPVTNSALLSPPADCSPRNVTSPGRLSMSEKKFDYREFAAIPSSKPVYEIQSPDAADDLRHIDDRSNSDHLETFASQSCNPRVSETPLMTVCCSCYWKPAYGMIGDVSEACTASGYTRILSGWKLVLR